MLPQLAAETDVALQEMRVALSPHGIRWCSSCLLVQHWRRTTTFQCLWHLRQYAESCGEQHQPHTTSLWATPGLEERWKKEEECHPALRKGRESVRCGGRFWKGFAGGHLKARRVSSRLLDHRAQSHSYRDSPAPVYHCSGGGTARAPGLFTRPNAPPGAGSTH